MNPIFALAVILLAWGTGWLLRRLQLAPPELRRLSPIDGLRGYLAIAVFTCHAAVWFFCIRHGRWEIPPSHFYTLAGESSVTLFFMISAFLFTTKLLEADTQPIDWLRLLTSRMLRLAPLYWTAMLMLFITVAALSDFALHDSLVNLIRRMLIWMTFTVVGWPELNGVADTWIIMAGVYWSLPYEWLFYLSLPLFALVLRRRVPVAAIVLSLISVAVFAALHRTGPWQLLPFVGGMLAAALCRLAGWRRFAATRVAFVLTSLSLMIGYTAFSTAYSLPAIAVLTLGFALIAGGQSLLGLLLHPVSRLLGEISYGLYLLQGFVLYAMTHAVLPPAEVAALSAPAYWGLVAAATPVLVLLCSASYALIEAPSLRQVDRVARAIRLIGHRLNLIPSAPR